jgi:benzoyl-CoA 2,3-dioxygenase component B
MSVGETGIGRVVRRTAELMREGTEPRTVGAIPLEIVQKYINEWSTASYDLFGGEDSSNAATYFAGGLKGRYNEIDDKRFSDHVALDAAYETQVFADGRWTGKQIPLRRAMNAVLLDDYVEDCRRGLARWNKILEEHGLSERLTLPSTRFNRHVGLYADGHYDPQGNVVDAAAYAKRSGDWLPTQADYDTVQQCMIPVYEPGKVAGWVAPPTRGFGGKALDFEYVLFH